MKPRILCTICARGGSKGVKNKNIRSLGGKPLISYSIEIAKQSGLFEHIVVSTDSDEIADVSRRFGAETFFKRPPELATDTAAKLPVIRHAFLESENYYGEKFDVLFDLDATSPLRIVEDLFGCYQTLERSKFDNVITTMVSRKSPYFNLVEMDTRGRVKLSKTPPQVVVRRQDAPACFDMNASIYVWTREALLKNEKIIGANTGMFVMPEGRSIDIDSELDFAFVEFLLASQSGGSSHV